MTKMAIIDPEAVLKELSSEEKIALLSGDDMWHTVAVPRLGVPRVRQNGVRGTAWTNGATASCFPSSTGLAASMDVDLARRIGEALGEECRARGVHCLLGPTTNCQRHPCAGRGFESFSEDPHLCGHMALAWIEGVQSKKVMTNFLGNEQEYLRRSNNSVIDERTMHEIYLEPFRIQCKARPAVFMTSYNRVNGLHAAEHPFLLRKILRGDFEFQGMIMSDWSGTYSSSEAVQASLDLEMPGPTLMRGPSLERDIISGKLVPADIDECALRVLHYVQEAQQSGIDFEKVEETIDTPNVRALLREAADSAVVLLKNDKDVLPISSPSGKKIAVIGPNAKTACYAGGGSANLAPTYLVTPLEAITTHAHKVGAKVGYTIGSDNSRWTPLLTPFIHHPTMGKDAGPGVQCDFYIQNPWENKVKPIFSKYNNSAFSYFIDGIPKEVPVRGYVSLKTIFTPDESGIWEFGLGVAGQADLFIDGKKIIDNSTDQKEGLLFFNTGAEERTGELNVEAGKLYDLEVRFSNFKQLNAMSPYTGRRGGIRIGGRKKRDFQAEIENAVKLATESDVVILCIGTNSEWESEAYDREDMKLPPGTDELVRAVLSSKPETIVVNQSGMPVEFPWLDDVSTIVQAFFGGNECGTAIADVVFGVVNPSGKLPITWPRVLEDYPSHEGFGHPIDTIYSEGLGVGYRYFDRRDHPKSAFPFGHGLSYTSFTLSVRSELSVKPEIFGAKATFTLTNTGEIDGAEVAQVYIHDLAPTIERPEHELAGFMKVYLRPGESKVVSVNLDHKAFSFYSVHEKCWIGRKGDYEIRIGTSSTFIHLSKPVHVAKSFRWIGLQEPEVYEPAWT
ncbi:beta-glucosidase [Cryptococcus gattii E566]|uniref:beta-glucosidase n=2 Tax=Cryptococcus gattii TaxID=37769 RepID=E6REG9_CRYGW|nr:Beta-glucosidase precursor (Gentiobiase) (Cellobiase) (Beta-D-glucoside glucohydrolase) [Cryptococcus gattii WM276]ADV25102.1 Beta-glucosidase precursor (Gentiobiase) (Cellobiase) (Beta-D-glucoside glucohydrolase) [Cryptococcus gattii WM276]KIR76775.1 beta-glucosidase [Cryptococcus gattii EJB2]KIY31714.1 beta-glucosidase [Cryptococcus gattii E566]KJE00787.1 beta-glucosidase [Cryptococcus gattii NT-10]